MKDKEHMRANVENKLKEWPRFEGLGFRVIKSMKSKSFVISILGSYRMNIVPSSFFPRGSTIL